MGLFELFRKKTGPGSVTDDKKLKEVARYQAGDHQLIKDLQVRPLGKTDTYIEGRVFNTLWNREIDVDIYGNASIEYAHRCAEAMNAMPDGLVDAICYAAKRYCLDFLDAVGGAEENGIRLSIPVDENTPVRGMLRCFDVGTLTVDEPADPSRTGYSLSGNCDWEEEHGIEIVVLDGKLVYLGEFNGESPWTDHTKESWNAAARIDA
ncbi:MAG: hypothetical protein IJM50_06770 [Lachnospiraceae bacterium]|nr:hypothetical protein [Lachnospiraceae bacterium]